MSLVHCPECGTKVSDLASFCPHCGYRSENENLPMITNKKPLARLQWEYKSLMENDDSISLDNIFPCSDLQRKNIDEIFGKAENLARVCPAIFKEIKSVFPKKTMIADITPEIQKLIKSGKYKLGIDKSGKILPTLYGPSGKVKQMVRLEEQLLFSDLAPAITNLQIQMALVQIINEIYAVQKAISEIHRELQYDRLALAESAKQQLEQAEKIIDTRLRESKILSISSSATDDARCTLFNEFVRERGVSLRDAKASVGF